MDFSKPYEPSPAALAREAEQQTQPAPRQKRSPQAIPALFKKKAA